VELGREEDEEDERDKAARLEAMEREEEEEEEEWSKRWISGNTQKRTRSSWTRSRAGISLSCIETP
jgi:hypothetical protein